MWTCGMHVHSKPAGAIHCLHLSTETELWFVSIYMMGGPI